MSFSGAIGELTTYGEAVLKQIQALGGDPPLQPAGQTPVLNSPTTNNPYGGVVGTEAAIAAAVLAGKAGKQNKNTSLETWIQGEAFNVMILLGFILAFIVLLYSIVSDQNPVEIVQSGASAAGKAAKETAISALI